MNNLLLYLTFMFNAVGVYIIQFYIVQKKMYSMSKIFMCFNIAVYWYFTGCIIMWSNYS